MILPDHLIKRDVRTGRIGITPFDEQRLQPASYDLTLSPHFRFYKRSLDPENSTIIIDPKSPRRMTVLKTVEHWFELGPQSFVLASSIEEFKFPNDLAGRCDGKSSLGRMGLAVHITAGFFDPGFEGTATFELFNSNHFPMRLYPGMPIAQMSFHELVAPAAHPYKVKGKYMGQGIEEPGPKESEYFRNFPVDTRGWDDGVASGNSTTGGL